MQLSRLEMRPSRKPLLYLAGKTAEYRELEANGVCLHHANVLYFPFSETPPIGLFLARMFCDYLRYRQFLKKTLGGQITGS